MQTTATVNITVDEDELTGGITDDDGDDDGCDIHGCADLGLVASGADEPVKVTFNAAIDMSPRVYSRKT